MLVQNIKPNALFLLSTTGEDQTVLHDDLPILAVKAPDGNSLDHIKQNASRDSHILNEATYHPSDSAPPSEKEITAAQTTKSYYRATLLYVGMTQSEFLTDSRSILVQKSNLDESIQILVPASLRRRILY